VAVRAREFLRVACAVGPLDRSLVALERRSLERRRESGCAGTGMVAILGFEACVPSGSRSSEGPTTPDLIAWEVDAALTWSQGRVLYDRRGDSGAPDPDALAETLREARGVPEPARPAIPSPARTSLPREAYVAAVAEVRERILDGEIYQANLTQTFRVDGIGDRLDVFERMVRATPAPRAAFVEYDDVALASVSPEVFVDVDPDGRIETRPIKGTRPRGSDEIADRAAVAELLASAKDRAELNMIVDLERNDLGRVCVPGTVEVPQPVALETFPAVHHLEARITGTLRPHAGLCAWVASTFPGGSISGAPKRRALEILRGIEPWRRGWYTGALLWIGDDGHTRSSILIRSIVLEGNRAWLGAGGGVVAGSDPLAEWSEANAKARALARELGFAPEDAR